MNPPSRQAAFAEWLVSAILMIAGAFAGALAGMLRGRGHVWAFVFGAASGGFLAFLFDLWRDHVIRNKSED